MAQQKNIPQIRFKGFTQEWKERKLGEIMDSYSGGTPSIGNREYYNGDIPFIRSGEINSQSTELFITEKGLKNSSAKLVKKGDVLYALYGATSGEVGISLISGAINQAILAIKPKNNYNSCFFAQWLRKEKEKIVGTYLQGGQGNLSGSIVKELDISIPASSLEQSKLGTLFFHLDQLITLKQQKYNKLVTVKKAMLEKMFPQNGATVPQIRFKGFTEEWEEKKLGEIGDTYTGLSGKTKEDFGHGEGRFITYMNVFSNPIAEPNLTEPIEIDGKQNEVKAGDVFFTTSSETPDEVGMSSVWLENIGDIYLNSFCFGYRPVEKINHYYLAYMLRSSAFRKKIIFLAQGISRYNISKTKVMGIAVRIPKIKEQEKVGLFFMNLDNLIDLQQRELEKLKQVKKGCLEKMFV